MEQHQNAYATENLNKANVIHAPGLPQTLNVKILLENVLVNLAVNKNSLIIVINLPAIVINVLFLIIVLGIKTLKNVKTPQVFA